MNEPIRILHVVAKMNRAGTETMIMNMYRHISRDKVQFDFAVCTEEHSDYEDEIFALGGMLHRYPRYTGKNHFSYKRWWDEFFTAHPEYKVIHGHIGSTAAIYLGIAKKHGRYTIAHSHGTREPLNLRSVIWRMYSYPTRYVADHFFGCSMAALETRYGNKVAHDSQRAEVLNNAIDAALYSYDEKVRIKMRNDLNITENEWVIGTIGRLSPQKNPQMIIQVLKELKNRGKKFKFLWVGVGNLKNEVERAILGNNLIDDVQMLGLRNDVPQILQAMDVFILPSVWEGLGIVAVEAQAAGLPTLCSDQVPVEAKLTELCEFIDVGNVELWVDKLLEVKNTNRENTYADIVDGNFDVNDVSKWLERFYLKEHGMMLRMLKA